MHIELPAEGAASTTLSATTKSSSSTTEDGGGEDASGGGGSSSSSSRRTRTATLYDRDRQVLRRYATAPAEVQVELKRFEVENGLFGPLMYFLNDDFTKTSSGQTYEKAREHMKKRVRFS